MIDEVAWFKIITGLIAAGMLLAGFLIIIRQYIQKRYRPSFYLAIAWLGFFLEAFFSSTRLLFDDVQSMIYFQKLSFLGLAPGFLGIMATVDSISRDSVEPRRFSMLVFILGINTFLLMLPLDEKTILIPNLIVISIGVVISNTLLVLYIRIHRNVPQPLKRLALVNVLGAMFVGVVYVFLRIVEIARPNFLPPVARVIEAIGALIQASVLSRHEQLFYVLPFKVQRLTVIDTRKGTSLYNFDWLKSDIIDQDVFSGIIQGMSMIMNESLKKGNFQEIKLEKGSVLINHDATHSLASMLIASKTSQVLHDGLAQFSRKFTRKYEEDNKDPGKSNDGHDADDLVKECFPFIPRFG
ncbi:MAG: hypothetical protein GYA24_22710 [Candidatus Lokiarchaeota archaeon]|nr:hypothetical protein [Candidatus Lokiarchaeota archaeon]